MITTHAFVDVDKYLTEKLKPAEILSVGPSEYWFVVQDPIHLGKHDKPVSADWLPYSNHCYIPLFPYCTMGCETHHAVGLGLELGIVAAEAASRGRFLPLRMHLLIGAPVWSTSLPAVVPDSSVSSVKCLRVWVGIAFLGYAK